VAFRPAQPGLRTGHWPLLSDSPAGRERWHFARHSRAYGLPTGHYYRIHLPGESGGMSPGTAGPTIHKKIMTGTQYFENIAREARL
jgi:hypothetical protein